MAKWGETQILRLPQQRVFRAGGTLTFNFNDSLQLWGNIGKGWADEFRLIFDTCRNLVLWRGLGITKVPRR